MSQSYFHYLLHFFAISTDHLYKVSKEFYGYLLDR